jgi:hypothetical protein
MLAITAGTPLSWPLRDPLRRPRSSPLEGSADPVSGGDVYARMGVCLQEDPLYHRLVAACPGDHVPGGFELGDPAAPIIPGLEDNPAVRAFHARHQYGPDPDSLMYLLPEGTPVPAGLESIVIYVPERPVVVTDPAMIVSLSGYPAASIDSRREEPHGLPRSHHVRVYVRAQWQNATVAGDVLVHEQLVTPFGAEPGEADRWVYSATPLRAFQHTAIEAELARAAAAELSRDPGRAHAWWRTLEETQDARTEGRAMCRCLGDESWDGCVGRWELEEYQLLPADGPSRPLTWTVSRREDDGWVVVEEETVHYPMSQNAETVADRLLTANRRFGPVRVRVWNGPDSLTDPVVDVQTYLANA